MFRCGLSDSCAVVPAPLPHSLLQVTPAKQYTAMHVMHITNVHCTTIVIYTILDRTALHCIAMYCTVLHCPYCTVSLNHCSSYDTVEKPGSGTHWAGGCSSAVYGSLEQGSVE